MSQQKAYLSVIEYGDTPDHATATTWTKLCVARSIKPFSMKAKEIAVTTLESPDEAVEIIAGLAEGGELEVESLYDSTSAATIAGFFRTVKAFRVRYGGGTKGWKFNGYVSEIGDDDIENGKVVAMKHKIQVTGLPVRSAALS